MTTHCNYLYGVIPAERAGHFGPIGLDGGEVRTVTDGELGILVSPAAWTDFATVPPEQTLLCLAQHQRVLERVMADSPLLPLKFGTYADDDAQTLAMLGAGRREFAAALDTYADKVEVDLAATWADLPVVLAEFSQDKTVVAMKAQFTQGRPPTTEQRVRLGQAVKRLLDDRRSQVADKLAAALRSHWPHLVVNPVRDDSLILNAALLIPRGEQDKLDEVVAQLDRDHMGHVNFRCVGPLPPYSFATAEVRTISPARLDAARQSLGLGASASLLEIKAAHRQLLQVLHPDRNSDPRAPELTHEITVAYESLEEFALNVRHTFAADGPCPVIVKVRSVEDLRRRPNAASRSDA
ncbi:MAG: GvpL/GvpF family gas vesicle protein [Planctomycetota bacterium]|nr:GvpL/GvpF family gas vesicle protein [Planctomycetota bacterium]